MPKFIEIFVGVCMYKVRYHTDFTFKLIILQQSSVWDNWKMNKRMRL